MAMQSSGQIKWSEIQSTHGGSNPVQISEYYGKYYTSAGARRPTSGEQKASYLFSTSPSVNGDWTSYGSWGSCSVECGGGTQTRSRACTNPSPTYGGSSCSGSTSESQSCNTESCGPYDYNTNGSYSWTAPTTGTIDVVITGVGWAAAADGNCHSHGCSTCPANAWNLTGRTTTAFGGSASGSHTDNTVCSDQYAKNVTVRGLSSFSYSVTANTSYSIEVRGGTMWNGETHARVQWEYQ